MAKFLLTGDKSHGMEINENQSNEIIVIGAGLPRTGTLSMKSALTILLKGKCYHMAEFLRGNQDDMDIWLNAVKGNVSPQQWRSFFSKKGCVSGVDYPMSLFWKELSEVYPNAKILLTTRNPETWYKSVKDSIWTFHENIRSSWTFKKTVAIMDGRRGIDEWFDVVESVKATGMTESMGVAIAGGPEHAAKFFTEWEELVKSSVPPERLLVHSAKEGWGPLCKFLDLPIPDEPYPRLNDTATIKKGVKIVKIVSVGIFYVAPVLITALGTYLFAM